MRQKRKKEEVARLRSLVGTSPHPPSLPVSLCSLCVCADTAYSCDPRVKRFKEEEKAEKLAKKRAKEEAARLEAQERERVSQPPLTVSELYGVLVSAGREGKVGERES